MSATILSLLRQGASLRYRPPHGFYVVLGGKAHKVDQAEARKAVESRTVRPNGIDQHGVYLFAANLKAIHAPVPALQRNPQALPPRPAAVPHALPVLPGMRRQADPENSAGFPQVGGANSGRVPADAGGLDAPRAQRGADSQAGKGGCVGCGRCGAAGASKKEMKGRAA